MSNRGTGLFRYNNKNGLMNMRVCGYGNIKAKVMGAGKKKNTDNSQGDGNRIKLHFSGEMTWE
jgi:hypothetical protein